MGKAIEFDQFYAKIRSHFAENLEALHKSTSLSQKTELMLNNKIVQKEIRNLIKSFQNLNKCESVDKQAKEAKKSMQLVRNVKLIDTKDKGRCLVATQRLVPGDLVIMESPFVSVMYEQYWDSHCQLCFRRLDKNNAIHCPKCLKVRYCKEQCLLEDDLHWAECQVMERSGLKPITMLSFRTVVKALQSSPRSMLLPKQKNSSKSSSELSLAQYTSRDNYEAVLAQQTHYRDRESGEMLKRISTAIYLAIHIIYRLELMDKNLEDTEDREKESGPERSENREQKLMSTQLVNLVCVLCEHQMACACNAYEISELSLNVSSGQMQNLQIGGAVYACISLTNHSCFPNTLRYNVGTTGVMRVSRPIEEGEELLDNYGHFYAIMNRNERRAQLNAQYFFQCMCRACTNDWPMINALREQELAFKCHKCGNELKQEDFLRAKKCKGCRTRLNVSEEVRKLIFDNDIAIYAAKCIAMIAQSKNGNNDDTGKIREEFTKVLCWLNDWSCRPSLAWIMCEQVVNHTWSSTGNCHVERSRPGNNTGNKKGKKK